MTDRAALILILLVLALFGLDAVANGGEAGLFLLRKLADLVEYLAFWR